MAGTKPSVTTAVEEILGDLTIEEGEDESYSLELEPGEGSIQTPTRVKAPGHLDIDIFSINDVILRIPPIDIKVEKQAFNHEWVTLRTRSSQKSKSGWSLARVGFSIVFKSGSDFADLARLVAGLRATPFCVVYSNYLEQTLGKSETQTPPFIERKTTSYNFFQPIMLALSSMVFSTMGHEGMPDCIRGTFEFYYFNYYPLTNTIVYKTGPGLNIPGTVWESVIWQKFYSPFIYKGGLDWPHPPGARDINNSRQTLLSWNEYVVVPKGKVAVTEVALTLVKAIKGDYKDITGGLQAIQNIASGVSQDAQAVKKIWDKYYQNLVSSGKLPSDTSTWALGDADAQELTSVLNDLISPVLKRISSTGVTTAYDSKQLAQAESLLAERLNNLKKAQNQGDAAVAAMARGGFERILEIPTYVNKKKDPMDTTPVKTDTGGRDLYKRTANYTIRHQSTAEYESGPQVIIQHMTVAFRNNLAVVPMVGYRHPLIQHLGATDITATLTMNVRNSPRPGGDSGLEAINHIYDTVLQMAQRFKNVPQGFTNLYIKNDFFQFFGLDEFVPERMSSETIQGMPGRSLISLELSEAALTDLDTVQDNPEQLNAEFIYSNEEAYREIYSILRGKLDRVGFKYGAQLLDTKHYFVETINIPRDAQHIAFAALVDKLRDYTNGFIERVHSTIFNLNDTRWTYLTNGRDLSSSDQAFNEGLLSYPWALPGIMVGITTKGDLNTEAQVNRKLTPTGGNVLAYGVLLGLTENGPEVGYLPNIDYVQGTVKAKANVYASVKWKGGYGPYSTLLKAPIYSLAQIKKDAEEAWNNNKSAQEILGDSNVALNNAIKAQQKKYDINAMQQRLLGTLGVNAYQNNVRSLLDLIIRLYLDLPEFSQIKAKMKKAGLSIGLMAYPDFKSCLRSVATWVEGGSYEGNASLIHYDPDCYLWYPSILGASTSPEMGLIDSSWISAAREHSITFQNEAYGKVDTFFQKRYLQLLGKNTDLLTNLVELTKESTTKVDKKDGALASSFYSEGDIRNATADGRSGAIVKMMQEVSLPSANAYPKNEKDRTIIPTGLIGHVTDIVKLWQGYNIPAQPPSPSKSQESNTELPQSSVKRKGKVFSTRDGQRLTISEFMAQRGITHCNPEEVEAKYNQLVSSVAQITNPKTGKPYGRHWGATTLHSGWGGISFDFGPPGFGQGGKASLMMGPPTPEKASYFEEVGKRAETLGFYWAGRWNRKFGNMQNFRDWISPDLGGTGKYPIIAQINSDGIGGMGDFMHVEWAPTKVGKGRTASARRRAPIAEKGNTIIPAQGVAATMSSPIEASIKELEAEQLRGQGEGLLRAYPTFKLYFIEDDSKERLRFGLDDFFSYNAVQSIRVIRDRNIPADLCEIYLTNVSGVLSNRRFRQEEMQVKGVKVIDPGTRPRDASGNIVTESTTKPLLGNTKDENPIASFCLQEGITIQLRLGYSSDPDLLDTVFNGVITNIEFSDSEDLIRIIAQSYAIELIQDLKGLAKPKKKVTHGIFGWTFWGLGCGGSTGRILEELLAEPEVLHFGRWKAESGGQTAGRDLLTNRWTFWPQPADDNIFAPHPDDDQRLLSDGIIWTELKHVIYRSTVWDIFQEMTLRHPNFIASAVPYKDKYGPRMTMFFGLPNQLYFARAPTGDEERNDLMAKTGKSIAEVAPPTTAPRGDGGVVDTLKNVGKLVGDVAKMVVSRGAGFVGAGSTPGHATAIQNSTNVFFAARLKGALDSGWIKPFRNYHLITSAKHIIANCINANSRDVANTITIQYAKKTIESPLGILTASGKEAIDTVKKLTSSTVEEETFTLKLDAALPPEETRVQLGKYPNITNAGLAKRYALGLLLRNIRDIYRGELIIIGNPKIKPYDVVYLIDEYSDMVGPFEVGSVIHVFDQQNGFRTEIKPDMLCAAAEWSLLSSAEALGVVAQGLWHKYIGGGSYEDPNQTVRQNLAWSPALLAGSAVTVFGGLMAHKILTYTQLSQPVVMSPLMHHGRVFAGGVPTRKLPLSLWNTLFGKWSPDHDAGFYNWIEDKKKEIMGKIGAYTGGYTQGDMGVWSSRPKGAGGT